MDDIRDVTYWASPVEGSQLATIFDGTDQERIFDYRAGTVNPFYGPASNFKYWWPSTGAMARGKGYAAIGSSTGEQTLTFTGIPHNGTWRVNLFYSGGPDQPPTENENFNMIGNPYPAAIDIVKVMEDNGNVSEVALWSHGTVYNEDTESYNVGDYVTISASGESNDGVTRNISSSQAFMIRTISTADNFFINTTHLLIGQNEQFYKGSSTKQDKSNNQAEDLLANNGKVWLTMKSDTERNHIMIGFTDRATDGYDQFFDAIGTLYSDNIRLVEKLSKFYSKIGNSKFVIQEQAAFSASKSVDLGFDTKKAEWFKISINKKQGAMNDSDIILVDTYLNIKHDLNRSDYEFEATKEGEYTDRFRLEFVNRNADLGDKELIDENLFSVVNDFDLMKVNSGKAVSEIRVYDMLGRMILQGSPQERSFELNTSSVKVGTLMLIEAKLEDGSMINTKAIKY